MYDTVKGSDWLGDQDAIVSGIRLLRSTKILTEASIICVKKHPRRFLSWNRMVCLFRERRKAKFIRSVSSST